MPRARDVARWSFCNSGYQSYTMHHRVEVWCGNWNVCDLWHDCSWRLCRIASLKASKSRTRLYRDDSQGWTLRNNEVRFFSSETQGLCKALATVSRAVVYRKNHNSVSVMRSYFERGYILAATSISLCCHCGGICESIWDSLEFYLPRRMRQAVGMWKW